MTLFLRVAAVIRESFATAWAQPVASAVTISIVAGMCASVLLTTGRTVGNEQAVLSSIDSAGSRSIVVRADADSGLDASVLDRLANIDGIAWSGAFGVATDVTNSAFPGSTRIPVRLAWGTQFSDLGVPTAGPIPGDTAYASRSALDQLGMPEASGGVTSGTGADYGIAGMLDVPDYLSFMEPLVVVPAPIAAHNQSEAVSVLVVIAATPDLVSPVANSVQAVLAVTDTTKVKISTSESLASLRALVQGQLGTFGRELVLIIFGLTAGLVAAILYGLVMMRRKDFGRRRALGAPQSLIVTLLLTQVALLSSAGALIGSMASAAVLVLSGNPLPTMSFFAGVAVLAIFVGVFAALVPALAAAHRDPIKELRVP